MRRVGISVAVAFAALVALPAVAQATFHEQNVNEVMLASATGDTNVRFVELYDAGGAEESFPVSFGPYGLAIYDAAGSALFWPAATFLSYPLFLLALFVVGLGFAMLQIAANPYVTILGPERTASMRRGL